MRTPLGASETTVAPDPADLTESGTAGKGGSVEFEAAIEQGSEWHGLAVTHRKSLSGRRKTSEDAGKPGRFTHVLCKILGFLGIRFHELI